MKKIFILLCISFSLTIVSQQKSDFWENVRFGGGVTLGFGSQTTVGISPSAIYDFENGFSLGAGFNYLYSEINDFTTIVYGPSLISFYQTNLGIQLSGEFDYHFAKQSTLSGGSINTNFPALHLGAAYNSGRFAFGFRYDVLYDKNKSVFASPFSPIVRFYF